MSDLNDRKLIMLIRSNPDVGIKLAADFYGGVVKAVCNNVLRGYKKEDIEEAWSDTFVKLWKYADKFDPDQNASLKTYIGTMARNAAIDIRRKRKIVDYEELEDDSLIDVSIDIEDDYARKQNKKIVQEVVDAMSEPERTVFLLRYYHYMSVKEVAVKTGLTPKKVENILYRKKADLKDELLERGVLKYEYA